MKLSEISSEKLVAEMRRRELLPEADLSQADTGSLIKELCSRHSEMVLIGFPRVNQGALYIKFVGCKMRVFAMLSMALGFVRKDLAGGFFQAKTEDWGNPEGGG